MNSRFALPVAASVLLSGCLNEPIAQRDPVLGEAVKYNAALQTINPDPVYPEGSAQPGDNGEHGAKAVQRYREGKVKQIKSMQTTSGTSSSSGGGTGPQ